MYKVVLSFYRDEGRCIHIIQILGGASVEKIGLEFPTRVSINITRMCNLRCKHCLSSSGKSDPDELITEELFGFIDQLKEAGKPTLAIGGGEPLTRKNLFEVIAYARKNDVNEYCNTCEIYEKCRGGCRCRALWQYGDINAIDPYCPLGENKHYEETISGHSIPLYKNG